MCIRDRSEAGQIDFKDEAVLSRGRIEAGGMLYYDHHQKRSFNTNQALEMLAGRRDYIQLVSEARTHIEVLPESEESGLESMLDYYGDLTLPGRYVSYSHNQESFRFLMDPMLATGVEKVSAMGYGNCLLYTSPSPRDRTRSRMPSSA